MSSLTATLGSFLTEGGAQEVPPSLTLIRRHHFGESIHDFYHAELLERIPLPRSLIIHGRLLLGGRHRNGQCVVESRLNLGQIVVNCHFRAASVQRVGHRFIRPGFSAKLQGVDPDNINWCLYAHSTCSFHDQLCISIHSTRFPMYYVAKTANRNSACGSLT